MGMTLAEVRGMIGFHTQVALLAAVVELVNRSFPEGDGDGWD